MPKPLRIFVSSPGDVPDERLRADLVIDKLNQDFSRYFAIESYRWEHEPMLASGHFQDAIAPPSESDIVVLILWSRLGTPLPEKSGSREYRGIDGRAPVTGTEWEFEDALAAAQARGAPDILVFRNISPATIDARDLAARAQSLAQLDALDAFWKRYFADRGVFLAASSEYRTLEEFATRIEESLRKLIERRIQAGVAVTGAEAQPTWLGNPFRGLEAYEFEHAAVYFGRDALVAKAAEQIATQARRGSAFLLVAGASGSGKSSLVKAAVVPRLMKPQRIEGSAFLRRVVFRPGDAQHDLFLGLVDTLTRGPAEDGLGLPELLAPGQGANDLAAHLRATADSAAFLFSGALARVTERAGADKRILPHEQAKLILVLDQFEELFTLAAIGDDDRRAFAKLISALAHAGTVWVIATMRADYWHRILDIPELVALAEGQGRLDVPPPSPAEMAEMIRKPALAAGLRFETSADTGLGLDAVLAEHATTAPGVLPLLSFTLDALYTGDVEKRSGSELTFWQYNALGGLEGAIATRAEEIVASLPESTHAALPRVLRALATVGDNDSETAVARSVPLDGFLPGSDTRSVVDAMIAARLLVASSDGKVPTVRLVHEALISRWTRARDQLATDRRDLVTRALVERQYARWQQAADATKRHLLLLRDPDLANALDLGRRWGGEFSAGIASFIAQSHRRGRRRQQFVGAAAAVFGVIALTATGFGILAYRAQQIANRETARAVTAEATAVQQRDAAVHERDAALIAQSRYLAGEADGLVKQGLVLGAIGLIRAALPDPAHGDNRPLVEDAVISAYNALYSNHERDQMVLPKGATAVASDEHAGKFVIATTDKLLVRTGLSETGQREIAQDFGAPVEITLAPKGDRLAMVGMDGSIAVWDLTTKQPLLRQPPHGVGTQVFFVAGGDRLVVRSSDQRSWTLLDVASGRQLSARTFTDPEQRPLASVIDTARGIVAVFDGEELHRLSRDDLSDTASVRLGPAQEVAATVSPDGKTIYVAAAEDLLNGNIRVLSSDTLAVQRTFGKVIGGARFLVISADAKVLALHGLIGIDFFDIPAGERLYHVLAPREAARGRFFGSGGSDYFAYGPSGFVRRYAPELGIETNAYRTVGTVEEIDELPDHSGFVTISDQPSVTEWTFDTETTSKAYSVPLVLLGRDMRMPAPIEALSIASDRKHVLASYIDRSARRWDVASGAVQLVRDADPTAPSIDHVASVANGTSVLAEKSGLLLVYSPSTGTSHPAATIHDEPVSYLGDVDATHVLMISGAGAASLVDLSNPEQPKVEPLDGLQGCASAASAVDLALCLTNDGGVRLLQVSSSRMLIEQPAPAGAKINSAYVAADAGLLAISDSKGTLTIKSLSDGRTVGQQRLTIHLSGEDIKAAAGSPLLSAADRAKIEAGATELDVAIGANALMLSPDGKSLAAAMPDRTVQIIDLRSGTHRDLPGGHSALAKGLAFSPDGTLLAVVEQGEYQSLNVYATATGTRIVSISLNNQTSPQLVRLDDGDGFATIDDRGLLVVHPVFERIPDLIAYLAREFPQGLTPAQRRMYFIE